jgi:hypothetical protein
MGESHIAFTPSAARWSSRLVIPGRSPMPSPFESWNDRE